MYGMNSIWRLFGTLVMEKNSYGIAGKNDREYSMMKSKSGNGLLFALQGD